MPTYSYACTECGHRFDAQQAFSDDALTECPQCGGRLRKLFGNVGVVFKGSGFYRTDARNDAKPAGGTARSGSTAGSGGSAGGSGAPSTGSGGSGPATTGAGGSGSSGSSSGGSTSSSSAGSAPAAAAG